MYLEGVWVMSVGGGLGDVCWRGSGVASSRSSGLILPLDLLYSIHCKNRFIVFITKICLFPGIHYRNKLNFVQITIYFPKLIHVCVILNTF